MSPRPKPIPLGSRFGSLVVLEASGVEWKCKCDCGNVLSATGAKLRNGAVKRCPRCVASRAAQRKNNHNRWLGRAMSSGSQNRRVMAENYLLRLEGEDLL